MNTPQMTAIDAATELHHVPTEVVERFGHRKKTRVEAARRGPRHYQLITNERIFDIRSRAEALTAVEELLGAGKIDSHAAAGLRNAMEMEFQN